MNKNVTIDKNRIFFYLSEGEKLQKEENFFFNIIKEYEKNENIIIIYENDRSPTFSMTIKILDFSSSKARKIFKKLKENINFLLELNLSIKGCEEISAFSIKIFKKEDEKEYGILLQPLNVEYIIFYPTRLDIFSNKKKNSNNLNEKYYINSKRKYLAIKLVERKNFLMSAKPQQLSLRDITKISNNAILKFFYSYFKVLSKENYFLKDMIYDMEKCKRINNNNIQDEIFFKIYFCIPILCNNIENLKNKKQALEVKLKLKGNENINKYPLYFSYILLKNKNKFENLNYFQKLFLLNSKIEENFIFFYHLFKKMKGIFRGNRLEMNIVLLRTILIFYYYDEAKKLTEISKIVVSKLRENDTYRDFDEDFFLENPSGEIAFEKLINEITMLNDYFVLLNRRKINLQLTSIRKINEIHDELSAKKQILKGQKLKIKKDSPFRKLLPKKYELIKDEKRLYLEGKQQHNCVFSYLNILNKGKMAIYSTTYMNERHTIAIRMTSNGSFKIEEAKKIFNRSPNPELIKELIEELKAKK